MLRKILSLFIQVTPPPEEINTIQKLLDAARDLFNLDETELTETWSSFPDDMRNSIWHKINMTIKNLWAARKKMEATKQELNKPTIA